MNFGLSAKGNVCAKTGIIGDRMESAFPEGKEFVCRILTREYSYKIVFI